MRPFSAAEAATWWASEPTEPSAIVLGSGLWDGRDYDPGLPGLAAMADPVAEAAKLRTRLEPPPPGVDALERVARARVTPGWVALGPDGSARRLAERGSVVLELRGDLGRSRCLECDETVEASVSTCPRCQGRLRPDVVLTTEVVPSRLRMQAGFLLGQASRILVIGHRATDLALGPLLEMAEVSGAEVLQLGGAQTGVEGLGRMDGPVFELLTAIDAALA